MAESVAERAAGQTFADSRGTGLPRRGQPFQGDSLVDMLEVRAASQPHDLAYTFLRDGEQPDARYTWAELHQVSLRIGAWLARSCEPGSRALLIYPPGLDFIAAFFGCLAAGVLPVPVPPAQGGRLGRGLERLCAIVADARPRLALTSSTLASRPFGFAPGRPGIEVIVTDTLGDASWQNRPSGRFIQRVRKDPPDTRADLADIAFLQYTSGSTAVPKGVMVTHANLLHNLRAAYDLGDSGPDSVSVSWLPVTHDMGLIEGVLQPAFSGCPAVLMSPGAFLQRPVRWLRAISNHRATRSGAPNFAYDLAASRVSEGDAAALDLSRWRAAYNGAEPVRHETMRRFAVRFAPAGFKADAFRPCYGLAEATLLVTTSRWRDTGDEGPVSCGRPPRGTAVRIVAPGTDDIRADGEIGEIEVRGPGVTAGYWNRPEETAATFGRPEYGGDEYGATGHADRSVGTAGSGAWLRTGDLGCMRDGALVLTGRLKDLLIVRGAKHFPQDLEHTAARAEPRLRTAAAASIAHDVTGDHIVLVAELDARQGGEIGAQAAIACVRQAIAEEHGIQLRGVAIVAAGTVPRTTSGKLQRFRVREMWTAGLPGALACWSAG